MAVYAPWCVPSELKLLLAQFEETCHTFHYFLKNNYVFYVQHSVVVYVDTSKMQTMHQRICCNFTYILSPAEDAPASAIIFLTFISSRPNFTVTSSHSGRCSGFHHLGHCKYLWSIDWLNVETIHLMQYSYCLLVKSHRKWRNSDVVAKRMASYRLLNNVIFQDYRVQVLDKRIHVSYAYSIC